VDIERRRSLAAAASALLPDIERAVVDSWPDMLPASAAWTEEIAAHARSAVRAALRGLIGVMAQGDLDDETWGHVQDEVSANGQITHDELEELLRTVRVVGVELLSDGLRRTVGLTTDERWALQAQAGWLFEQLSGGGEEIDAHRITDLLARLQHDGPDDG
jgi:hypothetical protein